MMKKQSSVTAQGIAAVRAIESSKPPEERICYDPLARKLVNPIIYWLTKLFAGYGERRAPGAIGFLVARTRYIDDYVQACLERGIAQLVILGAGLDSRAYRFAPLAERVNVFEVDHPATQQKKCRKLAKIFSELPKHVAFVPIDFNQEALEKLYDFGYAPQCKTLFIWEGVTYYLTAEAVHGTLDFVARHSAAGSAIVFDYVYTSALNTDHQRGEIVRMQRYRRFTGEGLTFGIQAGQVDTVLHQRGYKQVENVTSEDLKTRYFTGVNRNRHIAPIYAIVHATVRTD